MAQPLPFCEDKIYLEPDLGDPRKSTFKALPAPPKTPKRVMRKYRFSAVFPLVFVLASFVLSLVVVLAGRDKGIFDGQYLLAFNTSRVGQDVITFERATPTSAAPSAASSATANPLDPLNPFSTSSPLNPMNPNSPLNGLSGMLGEVSGNLTDAVDSGLGELVNGAVEEMVQETGIRDVYYVYLLKLCTADGCRPWSETEANITAVTGKIQSSVVVGETKISVPLIAKLTSSLDDIVTGADGARKAVLAFFIISMGGLLLSAVATVPAVFFPQSRLLIYTNLACTTLAALCSMLTASMVTSLIVGTASLVGGFGGTVGVEVSQGVMVIVFVWVSWLMGVLASVYWGSVWFTELRMWRLKYERLARRRSNSYNT